MLKVALLVTGFCVFTLTGCASSPLESLSPGATASEVCKKLISNPHTFRRMVNRSINVDLENSDRVSWNVEKIIPDFAHATRNTVTGWIDCPAIADMSSGYKIRGSFILMKTQYETTVIWESDERSVDASVVAAKHAADVKKFGAKAASEWEADSKAAYTKWIDCMERISKQGVRIPTEDGGVVIMHNPNLVTEREIEECGIKPSYPRPPHSRLSP